MLMLGKFLSILDLTLLVAAARGLMLYPSFLILFFAENFICCEDDIVQCPLLLLSSAFSLNTPCYPINLFLSTPVNFSAEIK